MERPLSTSSLEHETFRRWSCKERSTLKDATVLCSGFEVKQGEIGLPPSAVDRTLWLRVDVDDRFRLANEGVVDGAEQLRYVLEYDCAAAATRGPSLTS